MNWANDSKGFTMISHPSHFDALGNSRRSGFVFIHDLEKNRWFKMDSSVINHVVSPLKPLVTTLCAVSGDYQAVKTYPHLYFSKFYIGVLFR